MVQVRTEPGLALFRRYTTIAISFVTIVADFVTFAIVTSCPEHVWISN